MGFAALEWLSVVITYFVIQIKKQFLLSIQKIYICQVFIIIIIALLIRHKRTNPNMNMTIFKKSSIALITTAIAVSATSVYAGGSEWEGKTTCYILKNDKLIKKSSCSYEAALSSSSFYSYDGYDFTMKDYKKISTSAEISAKTDKNDDAITDKDGSTLFNPAVITINDKPATSHYRYAKTLKAIPKQQVAKFQTSEPKGVLSCMQAKDKALEVCAPYPEVSFSGH